MSPFSFAVRIISLSNVKRYAFFFYVQRWYVLTTNDPGLMYHPLCKVVLHRHRSHHLLLVTFALPTLSLVHGSRKAVFGIQAHKLINMLISFIHTSDLSFIRSVLFSPSFAVRSSFSPCSLCCTLIVRLGQSKHFECNVFTTFVSQSETPA